MPIQKPVTLVVLSIASMFVLGLVCRIPTGLVSTRLAMPQVVHAQEGCSVASLHGEYLMTGRSDNRSGSPDPTMPRVMIAVWIFDGQGNLSGFETTSAGGEIRRRSPVAATYTLDPDCTGTLTFSGASMSEWELFITTDGSAGETLRLTDGTIATRSFKKRDIRKERHDR